MNAPELTLRARELTLRLGGRTGRPLLMGIVNASAGSFSDGGLYASLQNRVRLASELLAAGADVIDVGAESASTERPPLAVREELALVVALVERVAGELGAVVSVDTYKPEVARAAIAAGARIVNDVSGLRAPELAEVCASTGAGLVIMHTRAAPRQRLQDPELHADVTTEVMGFLQERVSVAMARGVAHEQLLLDPGPDFAKTPAQTIRLLSEVARLHELGRPLLMAISRKDFIGALTARPPRQRLPGTLAALAHGVEQGAHVFRVHDVGAAAEFLAVRAALAAESEPSRDLALADEMRYDREPLG